MLLVLSEETHLSIMAYYMLPFYLFQVCFTFFNFERHVIASEIHSTLVSCYVPIS